MTAVVSYRVVATDRDQSLIGSIEHLFMIAAVLDMPTWNFDASTVYAADRRSSQTTFVSEHRSFSLSQDAVLPEDILKWQEFIRSAARGDEFQFYPEAIPPYNQFNKAYNCKLDISSFGMSAFGWDVYTGGFDAIIMSEFDRPDLPTFLQTQDRRLGIQIRTSPGLTNNGNTLPLAMVNGVNSSTSVDAWATGSAGQPVANEWIEFTFPFPVVVENIINVGPAGGLGGTWRAQWLQPNGQYADGFLRSFTPDQSFGTNNSTNRSLKYRLFGISGTMNGSTWINEIEFS